MKYKLSVKRMNYPISNNLFKKVFRLVLSLIVLSILFFPTEKVHAVLEPTLVKDINTKERGLLKNPLFLTTAGDFFYFNGDDGIHNEELWRSDGTVEGTLVLRKESYGYLRPYHLYGLGTTLFFSGEYSDDNGQYGRELWKSDGTEVGTVMVKDINPGYADGLDFYSTNNIGSIGSTLYFSANDGVNGYELWKSDGTEAGTVMVKDINSGGDSNPKYFTTVGTTLYFSADDGVNGYELWKSDGTEMGTVKISARSETGTASSDPSRFSSIGSTLYFSANDGVNGIELWKSDGTEAGTVMVKDIYPAGDSLPQYLTAVGTTLYFKATDGVNGTELWKSDGTEAGTVMVKDINSGGYSHPEYLTAVGTTLYFSATDGVNGMELWKSDGTERGTVMVKDINPGGYSYLQSLTAVGTTLYFKATDGVNGTELWKSDGTEAGTVMVKDISLGNANGLYIYGTNNFTPIEETLYFSATDGINGYQLWKSDGTEAGTVMVKDNYQGGIYERLYNFTVIGNVLYFFNGDDYAFWKSDGTSEGTVSAFSLSSWPQNVTVLGDTLYFNTNYELWKSNGTEGGYFKIMELPEEKRDYYSFDRMTVVGTKLLFKLRHSVTYSSELWRTDGTQAGTVKIWDFYDDNIFYEQTLFPVANTLYFQPFTNSLGNELWKLDVDILPPVGSVSINSGSQYTTSPSATLTLNATDVLSTVSSMMVCDNDSFTGCEWEIYQTSKTWIFNETEGTKTIYVKYKDSEGNESEVFSDSIVLQYPVIQLPEVKVVKPPIIYINPVIAEEVTEEEQEVQEEEKEEEREEVKEVGIQVLQFVDGKGNPMVGAVVVMDGKEYVTDVNGEIKVKNFDKNKTYKVEIEYKGVKYTEEVLGTRDNFNTIVVDTSNNEVKGFDWKVLIYVFSGLLLLLILFLLLSRDKKEQQPVSSD